MTNEEGRLKILILAPNYINRVNWGHQLFRNEIARQHDVVFHGSGHDLHGTKMVSKLVEDYGPFDIITMGENPRHFSFYNKLAEITDILKVCFVGDYFYQSEMNYNKLIKANKVDVVFLASTDCLRRFRRNQKTGCVLSHTKSYFMPWYVNTNIYSPGKTDDYKYEVMCVYGLMDAVYPKRRPLQRLIMDMPYKTLVGNWTQGLIRRQKYVEAIRKSLIFVSANGVHNEVTMKYTECMACATLFMTNKPRDADILGFKDGENIVFYSDFDDMKMKIDYYLTHHEERNQIRWKGYEHVQQNLSLAMGVKNLGNTLKKELKKFSLPANPSTL